MQVAEFARYTGRTDLDDYCRDRYERVLVPNQVGPDGSFPEELRRTKPYGYSLFNLDAMATVCQILSTSQKSLWTYEQPTGEACAGPSRSCCPSSKTSGGGPTSQM